MTAARPLRPYYIFTIGARIASLAGPSSAVGASELAPRHSVNGVIPRADGSAVFILRFDPTGGGRWFGVLASLNDTTKVPFEIRTGGNPLASVVLDPAFAREMVSARPSSSPRPPDATLPTVGQPVGYVPSAACTVITFTRATDGASARWTFTCRGLMTREAWREGLRRTALDQGWRETASQAEVLEFVWVGHARRTRRFSRKR